jgi:hypothetical protein
MRKLWKIALSAAVIASILTNLPDIKRYVKIATM